VGGLIGGFAIFVKFSAAFFVIGGALGLALGTFSIPELVRKPQLYVLALLGILPAAAYLFDGLILSDFLRQQFGGRFIPALLAPRSRPWPAPSPPAWRSCPIAAPCAWRPWRCSPSASSPPPGTSAIP
jgi:hypothetical protein